jgi:hypothetical protein
MMDSSDNTLAINAAFVRLAIDTGAEILVESRCNRCGFRMVAAFVTIGRAESEHLLECMKKQRAQRASSSGSTPSSAA